VKCTRMNSMEKVLQIIGNENRRKILTLLSEEPHYISQIAKKLDVTQPAILKHLSVLEGAGLIEGFWRKSPLGAARKYYRICDSVDIEIAINPEDFRVARRPQRMSCPRYLEIERVMTQLTEEINKAEDVAVKATNAQKLMEMADVLLSCQDYDEKDWNCRNCRRMASLRKEASQIILHVSRGEVELGLRRLTEAINQLVAGLLPK